MTTNVTAPTLTAEEIEARENEGIVTIDAKDARLDLVREYRTLMNQAGEIKKKMETISALLKEEAEQNGTKAIFYKDSKIVSFTNTQSRSADYDTLFKKYPNVYNEVVTVKQGLQMKTSEIKD